ncbi:hypothetical protein TH61_17395 [Rufibacter sp. DG15C]|nr:hypothetical protein TH61_17395 [Rufibacter sp. DG15C]
MFLVLLASLCAGATPRTAGPANFSPIKNGVYTNQFWGIAFLTGPPQKPGNIVASAMLCSDGIVYFSVPIQVGVYGFIWSLPNGWAILSGQGTNRIQVQLRANTFGVISVYAPNELGDSPPATLAWPSDMGPAIGNTVTGEQEVCAGATASLLTGGIPAGGPYTYRWERSTAGSSSGYTPAAGVNNSKDYSPGALAVTIWFRRKIITTDGCEAASNTVKVAVSAPPIKPSIVREGNTLTSSVAGASYQWILNGNNLSATTKELVIAASGSYQVRVVSEKGCLSAISNPQQFNLQPTGIKSDSEWKAFHLVPNPSGGRVGLETDRPWFKAELMVIDAMGKVIYKEFFQSISTKEEIDLGNLPIGSYSVQIRSGEAMISRRLLIAR